MTADRYAALRAALAAGPTPGRAIDESATHVTVRNADGDAVFHDDKRIHNVLADARLIAACDPETIAALLAERDALRDALKPFAEIPLEQINTPETFGMDVLRARAALAAQGRT